MEFRRKVENQKLSFFRKYKSHTDHCIDIFPDTLSCAGHSQCKCNERWNVLRSVYHPRTWNSGFTCFDSKNLVRLWDVCFACNWHNSNKKTFINLKITFFWLFTVLMARKLITDRVFAELKRDPSNLKCFECGVANPTWASGITLNFEWIKQKII